MSISDHATDAGALVLASARAAGLDVRPHPTESGRLRVSPPERLTADLRAGLLAHRARVLACLVDEDRREAWEERAAILEHDAGLRPADAEREARRLVYG